MCQIAVQIPEAVLFDTHMTAVQANDYAKKLIALDYYTRLHVSIGYCAQIAQMSEEDFIKYLGQNGISIFQFDGKEEFEEELKNA
jgi:predicted HTH domain antitoxin